MSATAILTTDRPRATRSRRGQAAPARRLVLRRLRRRRHDAADRRRGALRSARSSCRAARCSMLRPAMATRHSRPHAAGATSSRPTTCRRSSSADASAPPPNGLTVEFREADAEALPFPRRELRRGRSRPSASCSRPTRTRPRPNLLRVCKPGGKIGLANWTPEGLHRPVVQDARQASAAAGRREVARAMGHAGASRRDVRPQAGSIVAAAHVRVSLPVAGALARRVQDVLRAHVQGLRGARRRRAGGADPRSSRARWRIQSRERWHHGGAQRISRGRHHQAVTL